MPSYINTVSMGTTTGTANSSWANYALTSSTTAATNGATLTSNGGNGVHWAPYNYNYNIAVGYDAISAMVETPITPPKFKCIATDSILVEGDYILTPRFDCKVSIKIRVAIGVFANKSFCKEFTEEEYKSSLIEFSEIFMNQLSEDNKLAYSLDNEYILK